MTWNHDRGLAPMLATSAAFRERHPDVVIEWEARSLRDFGDAPTAKLAELYDMVVLDHPFMGDLASSRTFLAYDEFLSPEQRQAYAEDAVGLSWASYTFDGHHWALPNDAASQVMSYRADLLDREGVAVPSTWDDVMELAKVRRGFVSLALTPLDSLMSFFSLCANAGDPCFERDDQMVSRDTGEYALEMLRLLGDSAAPTARTENPIALYERMSSMDETAYCPLAFGYSNYSRPHYRSKLISYGLIPSAGHGPIGATLGGAGIAISASCPHRDLALEYATWASGRECQRTLYVESGGQPGSRAAWEDDTANALTNGYFHSTLPVLQGAWLRPRYRGFIGDCQNAAGQIIAGFMCGERTARETLDDFDSLLQRIARDR
jgi:multiple sugar transport system substrate-binding protein